MHKAISPFTVLKLVTLVQLLFALTQNLNKRTQHGSSVNISVAEPVKKLKLSQALLFLHKLTLLTAKYSYNLTKTPETLSYSLEQLLTKLPVTGGI